MAYKTILTFVGVECSTDAVLSVAKIASEADAHLSISVFGLAPPIYPYVYGAPYSGGAYVGEWKTETDRIGRELDEKVEEIENLLKIQTVSADVSVDYCDSALIEKHVTRRACVCDLIVLPEKTGLNQTLESEVVSTTLFQAPVGMVRGITLSSSIFKANHAFIAWNSTNEAANAVHRALPLIINAEEVTVAVFDPVMSDDANGEEPGSDIAMWLSRHGCKVNLQQFPSGGNEISDAIVKRACEVGADVVVMGAYGHTKLSERIFGGTTRSMLEQKKLPVFMSH